MTIHDYSYTDEGMIHRQTRYMGLMYKADKYLSYRRPQNTLSSRCNSQTSDKVQEQKCF